MLFSTPAFFVFFLVYLTFHLVVPARYRVFLIVAGSTIFYAWWKVEYTWLPYVLMLTAYGGVVWMERTADSRGRKRRAAATIVLLFVPLLFFKYTDFFYRGVIGVARGEQRGGLLNLPLPLGVSFITFTLTAFVVDTYKRRFPAGQRPWTVLAYVLFFPHLIAGPILRPHELIPQLDRPGRARRRLAVPLAIFTIGLVKKLVFADQIAEAVDTIYRLAPGQVSAPSALLAIYGFSAQIYCDFSGYTDMAIGLALMLGVRLPNNFLRPYAAASIVDFWRRWHITLSYWLRDYLYIPLGGNRGGRAQEVRNVVVTMTLGGLWHGANWTFVIWGLLHGFAVASVHWFKGLFRWPRRPTNPDRDAEPHDPGPSRLPAWAGVLLTFHFVTMLWVFFRAPSVADATRLLSAPFVASWNGGSAFLSANIFIVALIGVFLLVHRYDDHRRIKAAVRRLRPEILWPVLGLLWIMAITVSQGSSAKFIYFDF
jgi:alginate O-acetyltransferase complex protein AlgI